MKRSEWKILLAKRPRGLSGSELARRIKQSPALVIYWAGKLGHKIVDGRKHPKPEKFDMIRKVRVEDIDWSQTDQQIATKHGIRRQRAWQLRQKAQNAGLHLNPHSRE